MQIKQGGAPERWISHRLDDWKYEIPEGWTSHRMDYCDYLKCSSFLDSWVLVRLRVLLISEMTILAVPAES